jgi:tRNA threonylcarbamoyladenosine biosynthesis protein TsaB
VNILAIDCSAGVLSLALDCGAGSACLEIDAGRRHSELLLPLAEGLLSHFSLKPGDLELVACMEGPGSFTGLRIAYAAAKGLSAAMGIPIAAVPTLDCMAYSHRLWPGPVLPLLDARKNSFFWAVYQDGHRLTDFLDSPAVDIIPHLPAGAPVLALGPGAGLFGERLRTCPVNIKIDRELSRGYSKNLLEIARNSFISCGKSITITSGPLYIRKSDAELSQERTGVRL